MLTHGLTREFHGMTHGPAHSSADQLRKVCRGNMAPVWAFLLRRVRSERTVDTARRNIMVHGADPRPPAAGGGEAVAREAEARERDATEEEVERLRGVAARQRKELRARIADVAREEAERKRMLEERSNARHKQVMLEVYDQQCDEACKIFAEYQRLLHEYVNQARDVRRSSTSAVGHANEDFPLQSEREVSSVLRGQSPPVDVFLVETSQERSIRKACDILSSNMMEMIHASFPALEGNGINTSSELDATKLTIDYGEVSEDVKTVALDAVKNPSLLLQSVVTYTSRVTTLIRRENEKIDIRADAELLRYKYENGHVIDAATTDASSPFPYQEYTNGNTSGPTTKGTQDQLLERQKAHVQQFLATEEALNKAAEAKARCQKLLTRLQGSGDAFPNKKLPHGTVSQNVNNNRLLELDVLAKEREVAGLRASLSTLTSEIQRLKKLCAEWREAEDTLKKKWKKIEEFDARRSEFECVYTALLRANMDASSFWEQQPLVATEYASRTIIPASRSVVDMTTGAKDLIEREVSAFGQCYENSLYKLPATPQALVEALGANGATGTEAFVIAEKSAALLTARAGARDPSAIPSICRISAALQYNSSMEGPDSALAAILESLDFCQSPCGSEANVLEDLAKAINLVRTRRSLIEIDRGLLTQTQRVQQDYERKTSYCLRLAGEQGRIITERWLPELQNAVQAAHRCAEDCKRVIGLVDEWWEQPAATSVDWVHIDGEIVGNWLKLVKQLQHKLDTNRPTN